MGTPNRGAVPPDMELVDVLYTSGPEDLRAMGYDVDHPQVVSGDAGIAAILPGAGDRKGEYLLVYRGENLNILHQCDSAADLQKALANMDVVRPTLTKNAAVLIAAAPPPDATTVIRFRDPQAAKFDAQRRKVRQQKASRRRNRH